MNELSLASREGLLTGGMRGPAATPGNAGGSLLVQAVRHTGDLKMPPTGKLAQPEIDALTKWVQLGLPWPKTVSEAPRPAPDTGRSAPSRGRRTAGLLTHLKPV